MTKYFKPGVNLVEPNIINIDDRGVFSTIPFDVEWSEINVVTTIAHVERGNHFHRASTELFILLEGEIMIHSAMVSEISDNLFIKGPLSCQTFVTGEIFYISPLTWHQFHITKPSKWFSMMSLPHSSCSLDIVRMD